MTVSLVQTRMLGGRLAGLGSREVARQWQALAIKAVRHGRPAVPSTPIVRVTSEVPRSSVYRSSDSRGGLQDDGRDSRGGASEFELNLGEALRGIRYDIEAFPRQLPVYTHIYRDDLLITDPHHTRLRLRGRRIYFAVLRGLRWTLRWYYGRNGARIRVLAVHAPARNGLHGANLTTPQEERADATGEDVGDAETAAEARIRWRFEARPRPFHLPRLPSDTGKHAATKVMDGLASLTPLKFPSPVSPETTSERRVAPSASTAGKTTHMHEKLEADDDGDDDSEQDEILTIFEGVFVYRFDTTGRVREHRVEYLEPTPGPHLLKDWRVRLLHWWPAAANDKPALGYISVSEHMRRRSHDVNDRRHR
ncbi:hypothetical protein THASP1DRAFT_30675 [Thamnocephalis sphaerospora]|uniref:Uncharacterized protein n=1 Tax=Thamnocephalis sphaerospora TaxID=78915 RepID=A0A4P9XNI2_9FUNG|nr:hypothetical protein THASP1DRAFT_30675 [Thamnocephalis sphaerospora]|eukprot:RKP07506.1 hypothetical protein THASP1DRAFT_30675 [Thamnocephalis sphaerospora]